MALSVGVAIQVDQTPHSSVVIDQGTWRRGRGKRRFDHLIKPDIARDVAVEIDLGIGSFGIVHDQGRGGTGREVMAAGGIGIFPLLHAGPGVHRKQ